MIVRIIKSDASSAYNVGYILQNVRQSVIFGVHYYVGKWYDASGDRTFVVPVEYCEVLEE